MNPTATHTLDRPAGTSRLAGAGFTAVLVVAALLLAGFLTGCGDSGGSTAAGPDTTQPAGPAGGPTTVVVHATDYAFASLPKQVPAGTRLELRNDSQVELHELVALRIPDGETRSVHELLQDPASLEAAIPATVLLAPPGGDQIPAVGDGTLAQPGRYAVVCMIPTGISPKAYLDAAAAAGGQKPDLGPDVGAPHAAHGMVAELQVS